MTPSLFPRSLRRIIAAAVVSGIALPALQAHTAEQATAAYEAYNKVFLRSSGPDKAIYRKVSSTDKPADFWMYAEELEMALDVYERTRSPEHKTTAVALLNGFVATYGEDWANNDFNDDICWASIAFSRAFMLFDDTAYKKISQHNYDLMYARAWDAAGGGGLFWKTDNRSKNSCVEGPGVIAAWHLFKITGDAGYRDKAVAIYDWERKNLFNPETGEVYDSVRVSNGRMNRIVLTYNSGTFIGAAHFLDHPEDAKLAADFVKQKIAKEGLLPAYKEDGDLAGFNSIFLRWMVRYMTDRKLEADYLPWLQQNADAAWKVRRENDGISWSNWNEPTAAGDRHSWGCSPSVVVLQVVPMATEKK